MSKSTPIHTAEVASPELDKQIEESIRKVVPAILARFFSSGGLVTSQEPPTKDMASSSPSNQTNRESLLIGVNASSQLRKILSSLDLTTKAFTKPLTKEKWKEIFSQLPPPPIKGTDSFMRAPTMEAGMKDEIRKSHGHRKTKWVFTLMMALLDNRGLSSQ